MVAPRPQISMYNKFKFTEAAAPPTPSPFPSRRYPDTQHPPDGYALIETDLHRATTTLEVASFPFLMKLKLRSAINLSTEALHAKAANFFLSSGVVMLNPRSLDALDGPYDLWEEATKETLELLLDADNHPMLMIDSPPECEAACLVGCLRRLQHWSMVAIHDEYHRMTMRETWYSTSQRFIERFDLELVTLPNNVPSWFRNHLTMLEEERMAEAELSRLDPRGERASTMWVHGYGAFSTFRSLSEETEEKAEKEETDAEAVERSAQGSTPGGGTLATAADVAVADESGDFSSGGPEEEKDDQSQEVAAATERSGVTTETATVSQSSPAVGVAPAAVAEATQAEEGGEAGDTDDKKGEEGGVGGQAEKGGGTENEGVGTVLDFRLSGFVRVCPLLSEGCSFTAKAWLQDEDD